MRQPRSLLFRTAITFGVLVLLCQLLVLVMASLLIMQPLLKSATGDLAGLMQVSVQAWAEAPPERRDAIREELRLRQQLYLMPVHEARAGVSSRLPFILMLEDALGERMGHVLHVVQYSSRGEVWYVVRLHSVAGEIDVAFPHSRLGTRPQAAAILTLVLSLLAGLLAAYLLARRINRPLFALNQAASQVARGEMPQIELQTHTRELDGLIVSFNSMARQVKVLMDNRATLLAGVSHDLRSPIARMRMALELEAEQLAPQSYERMERYLAQMNELISQYLDFSRGAISRETQPVAIADLVDELVSEAEVTARMGNLSRISVDGPSLSVSANLTGLRRILQNLVENALRYSEGRVEVNWRVQGEVLVLEVADRGPGVTPGTQEQLFSPFVRGEGSRNPRTGGLGLGLAICREIAQSQGWQVELLPRTGGGTIARLSLAIAHDAFIEPEKR